MDIQQELRALVVALNGESIEYALCGGLAVAFHGYARFTNDIDILIAEESLESALKVAEGVGFIRKNPVSQPKFVPDAED